jgi:hypothetical protein
MYRQFDQVAEVFFPRFSAALPDLDPELVQWRVRWYVIGVIVAMFANADALDGPFGGAPLGAAELEVSLNRATDFVAAGLEAPVS